ncbi:MAG: fumarylacetoacetate hydrolase family protein [Sphingomonadales bacterium]|nr:fumarylacetoacetate hydrolase family protein [Sphingomonadales bacterium]
MKLATFSTGQIPLPELGVVTVQDSAVVDLAVALSQAEFDPRVAGSMQDVIEGGADGLAMIRTAIDNYAGEPLPIGEVKLHAPLPRPVQIRDCMCFEEHLVGSSQAAMRLFGQTQPSERSRKMHEVFKVRPIYYKANRMAVIGPDTDVHWPAYSKVMDYELEMGCVIGKTGRDISRDDARAHIFGFMIFNDFSARDTQGMEMESGLGPSKSKDFDGANAMGPWIVTIDEFYPHRAAMTVRVNGEVRSVGNSSSMTVKFEDLIAFISTSETLHAGEILGSGTVGGGCGLEAGNLLADGDAIELEIEGIGVLRNRVFAAKQEDKL